VLNVREVAARLKFFQSKIYGMVERGELPHHKIGGAIRISEEQLTAYLETTKRERGEPPLTRKSPRPRLRHVTLR
jgi:excisionase family DNA binding protein